MVQTREPGGAPGAERLRGLLLDPAQCWAPATEAHLHFAARAEHLACTILPALAAGRIVVCDRFADSTLAYQGYGQGADRALIEGLTALLPRRPDLTLVLTLDPALGAARVAGRGGAADRYERMEPGFHARVAAGFAAIAAREPGRCRLIDAAPPAGRVHRAILREVTSWLAA